MKNLLFILFGFAAFTSINAAALPPVLLNKINNDTLYGNVRMQWLVKDNYLIEVQLSKNENFNHYDDVHLFLKKSPQHTFKSLQMGTQYYLRARSINGGFASAWSDTTKFYISDAMPAAGFYIDRSSLSSALISWKQFFAYSYKVELDTSPSFNSVLKSEYNTNALRVNVKAPFFGKKWYYRICAIDSTGKLYTFSQTTLVLYYYQPQISFVNNNFNSSSQYVSGYTFNNVQVEYQNSLDSTFSKIESSITTSGSDVTFPDLYFGKTYFLRARFVLDTMKSQWSDVLKHKHFGPIIKWVDNVPNKLRTDPIQLNYTGPDDRLQVAVTNYKQFKKPVFIYSGKLEEATFNSPLHNDTQFFWVRAIDKVDTSEWTMGAVVLPMHWNHLSFNFHSDLLDSSLNKVDAGGYLRYIDDSASIKIIDAELDTSPFFNSSDKVIFQGNSYKLKVPDLMFGQTYYLRYRITDKGGYKDDWSGRTIKYNTRRKPILQADQIDTNNLTNRIITNEIRQVFTRIEYQVTVKCGRAVVTDTFTTNSKGFLWQSKPGDTVTVVARLINAADTSESDEITYSNFKTVKNLHIELYRDIPNEVRVTWLNTPKVLYVLQFDSVDLRQSNSPLIFISGNQMIFPDLAYNQVYYCKIAPVVANEAYRFSGMYMITTGSPNSIDEVNSNPNISVYPNPFSTFITFPEPISGEVAVFDINGKVCWSIQATKLNTIDLSILPAGSYLLQLKSNDNISRQRLIKL
ncbi:T9SS type A sorting domain-containing protein [bacterium]|nr:T9SS type A sorting domain-containing protein [bacterium]